MVDATGLIHMNGRIYDPELGRFLSPDPNIPEPGNTQAFNRYAYVYNNPLSYTDPSGFVAIYRNKPANRMGCDLCFAAGSNWLDDGSFGIGNIPVETLMGRISGGWNHLPEKLQSKVVATVNGQIDAMMAEAMSPEGVGATWAYQNVRAEATVDWIAGFGDTLSSNGTREIRNLYGFGNVDMTSPMYEAG